MNDDEFGLRTDEDHLRALRRQLIDARNILLDVEMGNTSDARFASHGLEARPHPRVTVMLECLTGAIREAAYMLDELDR
jgi:hypothetical protein